MHLYAMLLNTVKGAEARSFVENPDRSGFRAWRQITRQYDPRSGADEFGARARVTHAESWLGQAKNDDQALRHFQKWKVELADYECRFQKNVADEDKVSAVKAIMPEYMFGKTGHFKGQP